MAYRVLMNSPRVAGKEEYVRAFLRERGCELIEHDRSRSLNRAEVRELVRGAHGYVPALDPVNAEIFDLAPDLRVVSAQGVGYDHIDAEEAARRGIAVCICAGANNHAVSELAFGLMLNLARHIRAADAAVREGGWPRLVGPELWGKTLGIVGLGRVGKSTALIARGFGMRVLATDIKWDITFADQNEISYVPLSRLLRESDFLSLHCPLNNQTRGLIDEAAIEQMKPTAYLINTARGPIVKESALVGALREKMIAGAGLDVFEVEPHPENPYRDLPNAMLVPHLGGTTFESNERALELALLNVTQVLNGGEPICRVN
ncbi:MAG: D-3-phosphoglycerate dehydrogenase [uncultured Thermomicrobiales bacterium]|uniref:D-3-phosphoglycerate dehydrogenase n=1 Tax=uncultured Thermomicrobiales bacterium TaxID=1645740 RepID=A0A6J4UHH9_9BACT|nr:MAG: D-3-phosphoglycerate dehydrogenase [uncultured Thermomicrobiales bacterium]